MKKIREILLQEVLEGKSNKEKSSHWIRETNNFKFKKEKVFGVVGIGGRSTNLFGKNFYHKILQRLNFDNINLPFNSKWYQYAINISNKQNRVVDLDLLRHVFTFKFLEEKIDFKKIKNICVIGDGQANLVSLALESKKFEKIISVNLPEVLLSDYELIEKLNLSHQKICISKTSNAINSFLKNKESLLSMISASDCNILRKHNIDLFINIASFGEMKKEVMQNYFDIIKSTKVGTFLYSCNREEKILPCGEITRSSEYPWGMKNKIIIDEICPWHEYFYLTRNGLNFIPKFKIPYLGKLMHKLVFYS